MDLQKQPHISSSIGSLFMTQLLMNPNWKSLTGLIKDKLQTRLPMDGEGTNPNNIEERSISLSLFCGLFWSKFWWRDAFHFREGPVPTCQSTLHNLEGTSFLFLPLLLFFSHLKSEWPQKYLKVLYANKGSIFWPFCNFWQTAVVLAGLMTSASNHGRVY